MALFEPRSATASSLRIGVRSAGSNAVLASPPIRQTLAVYLVCRIRYTELDGACPADLIRTALTLARRRHDQTRTIMEVFIDDDSDG